MTGPFDSFVVFAEMRTGSNFLETNLNALDGVTCHGEAFNPHFIGYPNSTEILGITQKMREDDPLRLLETIRQHSGGLGGFRYFHDHDPRVLEPILDNPRCAKIVLTRNPVESFVSWKIAQDTGQWKLTNVSRRKAAQVRVDPAEFESHMAKLQDFQVRLLNGLQTRGQAAFFIDYEDIRDLDVMNGLAAWLGVDARLDKLDTKLKVQNPAPLSEKVTNYEEMAQALARMDGFNLSRTPNFEPRRASAVPSYMTAAKAPLIYLPIRSGPEAQVAAWLAALDNVSVGNLPTGMAQKPLRQWKRTHPGHRSFTVLRHPVARAHHAFCTRILQTGPGSFPAIRETLRRLVDLPVPDGFPDPAYDAVAHRAAFLVFLDWVRANLQGQTSVRVDPHWASQSAILSGFGQFAMPDCVIRETDLGADLAHLARQVGIESHPDLPAVDDSLPFDLSAIYDAQVEAAAKSAYQRDYVMFGFGAWGRG